MSKNKPNPTTTAPVLEDAAEPTLVQQQVANARSMGFEVETNEAGEPVAAVKEQFVWSAGEVPFMTFIKGAMDALTAIEDKVATTAQGPQSDGPLDNPHMRDAFYGTPVAPTGGLNVEVSEKGEVLNVTRDTPLNAAEGTLGEPSKEAREEFYREVSKDIGVDPNKIDLPAHWGQVKTEPTLGMDVRVVPKEPAEAIKEDGVQLSAFATRMAWIEAHGTTHEQYVKNVMENYVKVGLTSVDLEKIAVEQKRLWRLFAYIHAHPQEFSKLFNIVLEFGREYREQLFNLHMLYRAQEGLALGADEMQCFNNLRTLVLNTIESKSRKAVKSILDVRKIVEHNLIPEHVRGLYVAFYM